MKSSLTLLFTFMMAALLTSAAHATLLIYEPFNYPVGTLTGQNGGKGFAGGWVTPAAVANQAGIVYDQTTAGVGSETPSLTWDGKVNNLPTLPTIGARYQGANTTNSNLTIFRPLATSAGTIAATNGGVLWLSAVYHFANQNFGAGVTIGLANGYTQDRGRSFVPATTSFIGVDGSTSASGSNNKLNAMVTTNSWTAGAYTETQGTATLSATLDLVVVLKYTFNSGTNTVEATAFTENDTLSESAFYSHTTHVSATLIGGMDPTTLTNLTIAQGRIANAQDEVRIGTTFTDVVTLPPAGPVSTANSTVVASPTSALADGISSSTITVTLLDSIGLPVTNKNVTLANTSGPQAATITPSGTVTTGTNGQAIFTVKSSTVGTEVFTATNTTDAQVINQTASVTFAATTGDASVSTVVASPTNVIANGITAAAITVTVKSAGGYPVANKSVTLGASSGIATISPVGAQTTGTNGQVVFTATATTPGTVVFTATNLTDAQVITQTASVQYFNYSQWSNSTSFYVLTTTNGANLPATALETNFPILVRLTTNNFNFSQAQTNGADIRFTTAVTNPLPYEIEQWDTVNGTASIWVQVPSIKGNTNQQLLMFWGNPGATSLSSGPSVFNSTNGFACVMHMNGVTNSVGTLTPVNVGTTATNGVAGPARSFALGQGINCGTSITTLPSGSNPHTTEVWFRGAASGGSLVAWGIQQGQGKVIVNLASPPHIQLDTFFGPNPNGATTLSLGQWYHTAYIYSNNTAQLYVNGSLDGSATGGLNIPNPATMYVGGWSGSYNYAGDIDEVRISSVARSTNWLWLEYQNQNALQTLVGNLVQPGNTFSVSPPSVTMNEGATTNLTAQAGGAIKVYWLLKQNGQTNVIAVDSFNYTLAAGRFTGNQSYAIQFKAIYADGSIQTTDIPVTALDTMPDPVFTLTASTNLWDGRSTLTVTPVISNWAALVAAGATNFNYKWNVAGVAVVGQTPPDRATPGVFTTSNLVLLRSQGSGVLTATLALDNGGASVVNTTAVTVQEPATNAWVVRTPGVNEKPVNNQFYARDNTGYGTIYYNGTIGGSPDSVFLNVYSNGVLYTNITVVPAGGTYALSARIPGGLITYSVQFGSVTNGVPNVLDTKTNLVCGDAYVIDGQSNAVAANHDTNGAPAYAIQSYTSPWIRTYGSTGGGTNGGWGNAVAVNTYSVGIWGMCLASNLVAKYQIPICIINGAVGGTIISAHQANPTNHYDAGGGTYSIYANLVTRVAAANLTHGIRGVLWHQGENDQAAADPTGNYDYVNYQSYFMSMSGAWKQDFPNIQNYYIYQIYPGACGMGGAAYSDMIREVQRQLPGLYSNLRIMSTLAQSSGSQCHFYTPDYCQLAYNMLPLVARDNYGLVPTNDITAPNIISAAFTTTNRNQIALVFNQNMTWNPQATINFFLDRVPYQVALGSVSNNVITLTLGGYSTNQTIGYVVDQYWNGTSVTNFPAMLTGSNGIAALTFYGVPIAPPTVVASPAPALNSLLPSTGRTNGGTVVTLTGSNFLSGASVQFGGNNATSVSVDSSTQITASTPAHAAGAVNVVVVNTNGLAVTNLNAFTYVLPPLPATLGGVGLSQNNLVMVWSGAASQSCVLLSATNLTQPRSTWTPVETNTIAPSGYLTNTIPVVTGNPQRYYLLSTPYN